MTMVVVVSLVEYKRGEFSKPKPLSKGSHAKSGGDKRPKSYNSSKEWLNKTFNVKEDKGKGKGKGKREEFTFKTSCFLCDSSHWAWDCLKRKTLNAMIDKKEKKWCSYRVNVAPKCL